jgi:hypothetical protein
MGSDKADTHVWVQRHGEGTTHHTPVVPVRLHWENESIEETHAASEAIADQWRASYQAADWSTLQADFYTWMQAVGVSSAAWAKRADFAMALRRSFGPG